MEFKNPRLTGKEQPCISAEDVQELINEMEAVKDIRTTLNNLVNKMDVPAEHKNDLIWLAKNLATNNKKHRDFPEAIHLVASLLKMTGKD
jgi:hypothetical protein